MRRNPLTDTTWPALPILPDEWQRVARFRGRDEAYRWVQEQEDRGRYFVSAAAAAHAWTVHEQARRRAEALTPERKRSPSPSR